MNRQEKRAAARLHLLKYAKWVDVPEFPNERIQVRPATAHDLLEITKLQADDALGELGQIVEALVLDWTFTDDDGEKLPLTGEAVQQQVPLAIVQAVCRVAIETVSGQAKLPFAPTSSSAPSPENHANDA